jgi:hypothetical protein
MKKVLYFVCFLLATSSIMVSCDMAFDEPFDDSLLLGKWQSGTLYYKYAFDGSGTTWDEADDVKEDEAQSFTWALVQSELTHIHIMEIGVTVVTKVYTVTELTSSSLKYKDSFGKTFSFVKVD